MAEDQLVTTAVKAGLADVEALNTYLTGVFPEMSDSCESLFIADGSGKIIADSGGGSLSSQKDIRVDDRDCFIRAKAGETTIGSPVPSRASGNPVAVVAVPLKNDAGQFAGIFGGFINSTFFRRR